MSATDPVHPVHLTIFGKVADGPLDRLGVIVIHGDRDPHGNAVPRYGDIGDGLRELADHIDAMRDHVDPEDGPQ